jgi:GNAT superfamily N-acetyltransferase
MNKQTKIDYIECGGQKLSEHLEAMAQLRITVFNEWPYLYEGSLDYEKKYLQTYIKSNHSFVLLALDGKMVIGATTAILAADEEEAFQAAFMQQGLDPQTVCYFGESILLPEYRGLGIGKEFMKRRLNFARSLPGVKYASFCAVVRPDNHPSRPPSYKPLNSFWQQMGFHSVNGMQTEYTWLDKGDKIETKKIMQFWMQEFA